MKTQPTLKDIIGIAFICGSIAWMVAVELHTIMTDTKDMISQNEAYRRYGRAQIEKWKQDGRLTPTLQGNRIYYKTKQLQKITL